MRILLAAIVSLAGFSASAPNAAALCPKCAQDQKDLPKF
jgi:hypothetical protein